MDELERKKAEDEPRQAGGSDLAPPARTGGQVLIYRDGALNLQVRLDGQTVWLTQAGLADLYQTTPQNVTLHIKAIYEEGELEEGATCKDYLQVRPEGARQVKRMLRHYSLDVILAVGYRVRSARGLQFRQWATSRLRELLVKGFVLDDERIKAGRTIGQDYFNELLARIRDIRASERLFYQKITDIYATSVDYDPSADITREFYAAVQNKLHWATHGHTAAEIVHQRADANKPNMGLTTWRNAPSGPIRKSDVTIAKNYLTQKEIAELNRVVSMYLDYAEDQAARHHPMHMGEWVAKLDSFLRFNERNVLAHAGTISHDLAEERSLAQFVEFEQRRLQSEAQAASDFDRAVEDVKRLASSRPPKVLPAGPSKPSPRRKGRKPN
ncbi:MAG: virulence RhuM family protein [Planctomycetota bacterium]|nr:virulence RhuM family protein [Planctomycetota bacterium]